MNVFKVGDKVRLKSAAERAMIDTGQFMGKRWLDEEGIREGVTYQVLVSDRNHIIVVASGLWQWAAYFELVPKSVGFMIDDES